MYLYSSGSPMTYGHRRGRGPRFIEAGNYGQVKMEVSMPWYGWLAIAGGGLALLWTLRTVGRVKRGVRRTVARKRLQMAQSRAQRAEARARQAEAGAGKAAA